MKDQKVNPEKTAAPDSSPSVTGTISLSKDAPTLGYDTQLSILNPPLGLGIGTNDKVYFNTWELTPAGIAAGEPTQPGMQYLYINIADYNHDKTAVSLTGSITLPNSLESRNEGHFYNVNVHVKKDGRFHLAGSQTSVDVGPIA